MNLYPVLAVAKISHKLLPFSILETVPPADANTVTTYVESAEKVAVQVVAAVAVTVVVALEAEVGV